MDDMKLAVARRFTRFYWDFGRPRFTKADILNMADGREPELLLWLRELERRGFIRFLEDFGHADCTAAVVEVLAEIPEDAL